MINFKLNSDKTTIINYPANLPTPVSTDDKNKKAEKGLSAILEKIITKDMFGKAEGYDSEDSFIDDGNNEDPAVVENEADFIPSLKNSKRKANEIEDQEKPKPLKKVKKQTPAPTSTSSSSQGVVITIANDGHTSLKSNTFENETEKLFNEFETQFKQLGKSKSFPKQLQPLFFSNCNFTQKQADLFRNNN